MDISKWKVYFKYEKETWSSVDAKAISKRLIDGELDIITVPKKKKSPHTSHASCTGDTIPQQSSLAPPLLSDDTQRQEQWDPPREHACHKLQEI